MLCVSRPPSHQICVPQRWLQKQIRQAELVEWAVWDENTCAISSGPMHCSCPWPPHILATPPESQANAKWFFHSFQRQCWSAGVVQRMQFLQFLLQFVCFLWVTNCPRKPTQWIACWEPIDPKIYQFTDLRARMNCIIHATDHGMHIASQYGGSQNLNHEFQLLLGRGEHPK